VYCCLLPSLPNQCPASTFCHCMFFFLSCIHWSGLDWRWDVLSTKVLSRPSAVSNSQVHDLDCSCILWSHLCHFKTNIRISMFTRALFSRQHQSEPINTCSSYREVFMQDWRLLGLWPALHWNLLFHRKCWTFPLRSNARCQRVLAVLFYLLCTFLSLCWCFQQSHVECKRFGKCILGRCWD